MMIISNTFQIVKVSFFRLSCLRIYFVACKRFFFLMNSIKVFDLRQCLILVLRALHANHFQRIPLYPSRRASRWYNFKFFWLFYDDVTHLMELPIVSCHHHKIINEMREVDFMTFFLFGGWQKSNAFLIGTLNYFLFYFRAVFSRIFK